MNALTKHESAALPALAMDESELIQVLQSSLYPGAALPSIKMVLGYCKATELDPMQKPVHIVPMWDGKAKQMRDVIMPGIGLYRTQAARTGEHIGTDKPIFGPLVEYDLSGVKIMVPEWCEVTVYRLVQGQRCAYTAQEFWIENYATAGKDTTAPNQMWKKRSRGQLAKCAEAQALRKAFPEIGSEPTAEEMAGKQLNDATVIDGATGEILPGFDLGAALADVEACTTEEQVTAAWKKHVALAQVAKDRAGYDTLKKAVADKGHALKNPQPSMTADQQAFVDEMGE